MSSNIPSQQPGGVDQKLICWLVAWLRRREWSMSEAEAKDVVSTVLIHFLERPSAEVLSLKAYFCWRIRNEVKERYRQRRERGRIEAWGTGNDTSKLLTEIDYVNDYDLTSIINKLPDREREVLLLNYVYGITLVEIAKGKNVSYSEVHRLLKKAIARCLALAGRTPGASK